MLHGALLAADVAACRPGRGQCAFWWLGQQSFIVKLGDTAIALDPYLSPSPRRRTPPLLTPDELAGAVRLVAASHDHADHLDRGVWPALAQAAPGLRFLLPELLRPRVAAELAIPSERLLGLDDEGALEFEGLHISAVAAAHELLDPDPATGRYPCLGYLLAGHGCCLYHAGDTCLYEGLQAKLRRFRPRLAFLPINGRDARRLRRGCIGNLTYQEAADLAGALRPALTVPAHWDMFADNAEDPALFADYMAVKYPGLAVHVPCPGECVLCDCPITP